MAVYFKMLSAFMKDRITSNVDSALIVAIQSWDTITSDGQVLKEHAKRSKRIPKRSSTLRWTF
ncbi:hypothetical protein A2U01_0049935 [Trifolium medium]|uniref:Uncharacterized protein n=1 Tax=Trifolium medium TaxID=97028 RepID=A0A392QWK4_9FABA|nr:hypothetical protein [Trifolium medium]